MPLLFSYGTLQHDDVQRATFGRLLTGEPDALPGFVRATAGPHANVVPGAAGEGVPGTVFEVSVAELSAADDFERPASYGRILARLSSGRDAWVYVHLDR